MLCVVLDILIYYIAEEVCSAEKKNSDWLHEGSEWTTNMLEGAKCFNFDKEQTKIFLN